MTKLKIKIIMKILVIIVIKLINPTIKEFKCQQINYNNKKEKIMNNSLRIVMSN